MHYLHLIIVKADSKKDAISQVESFLEHYQDHVYDWYEIGGRWESLGKVNELKTLLPKLKEMQIEHDKETAEMKVNAIKYLQSDKESWHGLDAHRLKMLSQRLNQDFSNENKVYNLEYGAAWNVPNKDIDAYMVVTVDIHS